MEEASEIYLLALVSIIGFALASQGYAHFSKKISSVWVNYFKTFCAFFFFLISVLLLEGFRPIEYKFIGLFTLSGLIGLGIGDWFLLKAYSLIGPGRTYILFAFQPIFVGTFAYFFLGQ